MDFKDKWILWCMFGVIAWLLHLSGIWLIVGFCITGILIKTIDANFANIIHWIQERIDSRQ